MPVNQSIDYFRVFKTRRDYCRALLEVSSEQEELIAAEKYTELLELLGRKQRILGRMQELRDRQPELWTAWRADRDGMQPNTRQKCEALLDDAERILADLMEQEKQSTDAIAVHRDATQRELATLSDGSRAHDAYRDTTTPTPHRRLDIGH